MDINEFYKNGIEQFEIPSNVENLFIDLKEVINEAAQNVFMYGTFKNSLTRTEFNNLYVNAHFSNDKNAWEIALNEYVFGKIESIINDFNPLNYTYMMLDGSKSRTNSFESMDFGDFEELIANETDKAKIISILNENPEINVPPLYNFRENYLSPTTPFMQELSYNIGNYLSKHKNKRKMFFSGVSDVSYIHENSCYKIFEEIRKFYETNGNKNNGVHCVYSLDLNCVNLALGSPLRDFILIGNSQTTIKVSKIYNKIISNMQSKQHNFPHEVILNDYILLNYIYGNMFLPKITSLEVYFEDGIEDFYPILFESYQILKLPLTNSYGIIYSSLANLFYILSKNEENAVRKLAITTDSEIHKKSYDRETNTVDIDKLRKELYYGKNVSDTVDNYLSQLTWLYHYSVFGSKSVVRHFNYNFDIVPLAIDIASYLASVAEIPKRKPIQDSPSLPAKIESKQSMFEKWESAIPIPSNENLSEKVWLQEFQKYLFVVLIPIFSDEYVRRMAVNSEMMNIWVKAVTSPTAETKRENYETLETLGDKTMGYEFTLYVYKKYPNVTPAELTYFNNYYMSKTYQAELSDILKLRHWIITGPESRDWTLKFKARTDFIEAFCGALSIVSSYLHKQLVSNNDYKRASTVPQGSSAVGTLICSLFYNREIDFSKAKNASRSILIEINTLFGLRSNGGFIFITNKSKNELTVRVGDRMAETLRNYGIELPKILAYGAINSGNDSASDERNIYDNAFKVLNDHGITREWIIERRSEMEISFLTQEELDLFVKSYKSLGASKVVFITPAPTRNVASAAASVQNSVVVMTGIGGSDDAVIFKITGIGSNVEEAKRNAIVSLITKK